MHSKAEHPYKNHNNQQTHHVNQLDVPVSTFQRRGPQPLRSGGGFNET
jgi:hypothetical protein